MEYGPQARGYRLTAVGADRFDRAAFHRFLAERFFLGALGLLVNEEWPPSSLRL